MTTVSMELTTMLCIFSQKNKQNMNRVSHPRIFRVTLVTPLGFTLLVSIKCPGSFLWKGTCQLRNGVIFERTFQPVHKNTYSIYSRLSWHRVSLNLINYSTIFVQDSQVHSCSNFQPILRFPYFPVLTHWTCASELLLPALATPISVSPEVILRTWRRHSNRLCLTEANRASLLLAETVAVSRDECQKRHNINLEKTNKSQEDARINQNI